MQTFDPNAVKPAFLKAIEATKKAIEARKVSAKLAMLKDVEVSMSPLTGHDDLKIKTARTSMLTFNKMINEFLYNKGEFHGIEFESFEDFESKLTTPDKEILIALLLDASYTKLPKRTAYCPECGELTEYDLVISDLFNNPESKIPVWEEDAPVYEKVFSKTLFDGVLTASVKMPTELKRNKVYDSMNFDTVRKNLIQKGQIIDSTDTLLMFIDSLEVKYMNPDTKKEESYILKDMISEIRPYLDNAPLEVHDEINEFINDVFNKYIIDLKTEVVCSHCGHKFNWSVSPESEFFRKTFSI